VGSDLNPLGADFIVDRIGILRMSYYSHNPPYRSTAMEWLEEL
jgi:hypothetical protein